MSYSVTWNPPTCSLVFRVTFRPTGPAWSPDKHSSRHNTTSQLRGLEYESSGWISERVCLFLADTRSRHHLHAGSIITLYSVRHAVSDHWYSQQSLTIFSMFCDFLVHFSPTGEHLQCVVSRCRSSTRHCASLCFHDCYVNEGNIFWLMSASNLFLRWQQSRRSKKVALSGPNLPKESEWEVKIWKILFYRADNGIDKLHRQADSCDFAVWGPSGDKSGCKRILRGRCSSSLVS